ncbi:MAG: D-tyrosyl-tRNA(Tyr) deacylase [Candidatus Melainabacteria bacterium]|nr:D-tyrosyl-tRNA(Tyr) deacylase [Candidatus Melainabacteria bacterium]
MKAVLQRVREASVEVDGKRVAETGPGLLVLLGVENGDTEAEAEYLAQKSVDLRIFADENGKMNRSLLEIGGQALVVSQFTLLADWRKGRRPGFTRAAAPEEGRRLYEHYARCVEQKGVTVATGVFGADMKVSLVNDGPVTLILEAP